MKSKSLAIVFVVLMLGAMPLSAAFDTYLEIEGIAGESLDANHRGWIEIESFSMGPALQAATEGGAAKLAQFHEFSFTKKNDASSAKLFKLLGTGKHFPKITITHRKAGRPQQEYMVYTLENAMVSSYQLGASSAGPGGAAPGVDRFTLTFSKISIVTSGPAVAPGTRALAPAGALVAVPTATPTPLPRSAPPRR